MIRMNQLATILVIAILLIFAVTPAGSFAQSHTIQPEKSVSFSQTVVDYPVVKTSYSMAPSWPASWIQIDTDPNENGTNDDYRDVAKSYFQVDGDYLYLRLELRADPSFPQDARYKWFIDINGDGGFSGNSFTGSEYLLFVEDKNEDGAGEVYFLADSDADGQFNEFEGPSYYYNFPGPVADTGIADYSISSLYVDLCIALDQIGDLDTYYLTWATDQRNPNLDQGPTTDKPDADDIPLVVNLYGIIEIVKVADPDDATEFEFTGSGGIGTFSLYGSDNITIGPLALGSYDITETVPAGWSLENIDIDDPDGGSNTSNPTATIDLDAGETVVVTFYDSKVTGSISGYKYLCDAEGGCTEQGLEGWDILISGAVSDNTTTGSDGYFEFTGLPYGTYAVSEILKDGWENCTPDSVEVTVSDNITDPEVMFCNRPVPSFEVTKEADTEISKVGDNVTYTVVITNTGSVDLTRVSVIDSLAGDLTDKFMLELPVGASDNWTYPYTVQAGDADPLVNIVTAVYGVLGYEHEGSASDNVTVDLVHPAITVEKSADADCVLAGDDVSYTVIISNTGDVALLKDSVYDSLKGDITGGFGGSLPAGASDNYTYSYTVQAGDPDPLINAVEAHYHVDGLPNDIYASDNISLVWCRVIPSFTITKEADTEISKIGDNITYTVTITNTGSNTIEKISVEDTLLGEEISNFFNDTIMPGASDNYTYIYTVKQGDADPLVNTAFAIYQVLGYQNQASASDNVTVELVHPAITVEKHANVDCVNIGDNVTYTVVISNAGDVDLVKYSVDDSLEGDIKSGFADGLEVGYSDNYTYTYTVQAGDTDPLLNRVDAHYRVAGLPNDIYASDNVSLAWCEQSGSISGYKYLCDAEGGCTEQGLEGWDILISGAVSDNTTTGSDGYFEFTGLPYGTYAVSEILKDGWENCTPDSVEVTVSDNITDPEVMFCNRPVPSFEVTKEADTEISKVGDNVTYTVVITNTGSVDLTRVSVIDSLAGDLTDKFMLELPVGASDNWTYPYTVQAGDADPLVNIVTAVYGVLGYEHEGSASDNVTVDLVHPAITVEKSADADCVLAGDDVSYTVIISNTGDVALLKDSVYDSLKGDITGGFGGSLPAGASDNYTYSYTVQAGDPDPLINAVEAHYHVDGLPNDIYASDNATVCLGTQIQPDNIVEAVGGDIYNNDGTNQGASKNVNNGQTAAFIITIQNDGTVADDFIVLGAPGGTGWAINYFDAAAGGNNITAAILSGVWITPLLGPGESTQIRLEVIPAAQSGGASREFAVTSASNLCTGKLDTVRAIVNIIAAVTGGGGGGGGGSAPDNPCPLVLETDMIDYSTFTPMTTDGVLCEPCLARDSSKSYTLEMEEGTRIAGTINGRDVVPEYIKFRQSGAKPETNEGTVLVSSVFNLDAYDARYSPEPCDIDINPQSRLVLSYNPDRLPENAKDLFIAFHEEGQGWLPVDPDQGTVAEIGRIGGQVNHFTPFAVLANVVETRPARFSANNLRITPQSSLPGEDILISADISNSGDVEGMTDIALMVNNRLVDSQKITVGGNGSQTVQFVLTENSPGTYTVEVSGLTGSFTVSAVPQSGTWWWWLIAVIVILLIAVGVWYYLRKRQGKPLIPGKAAA